MRSTRKPGGSKQKAEVLKRMEAVCDQPVFLNFVLKSLYLGRALYSP
jgi:hypothetical protein